MSYENFCESAIGSEKTIRLDNGYLRFVKIAVHQWFVEYALRLQEPFDFCNFTTVLTEIEASCLYEKYSK